MSFRAARQLADDKAQANSNKKKGYNTPRTPRANEVRSRATAKRSAEMHAPLCEPCCTLYEGFRSLATMRMHVHCCALFNATRVPARTVLWSSLQVTARFPVSVRARWDGCVEQCAALFC